jgi:hypothetical protein
MMLALALPTVVLTSAGPAWLTAVLLAANAVLIAVLSAPLVRRLARVRRTRSIAGAAALWVLWCGMLAVVGVSGGIAATVVLVVGTLLFTVAEAVHAPISTAAAAGAAPAAARGRYLAAFQHSFAAASVIAPAFFGALYPAGHALPFLVLGLVNALSVPALLRLERRLPVAAVGATRRPTSAPPPTGHPASTPRPAPAARRSPRRRAAAWRPCAGGL